jgi:hypothetical protein
MQPTTNLNSGHRNRIMDRFLKTDIRALPDYEVLGMTLVQ